MQFEHVFDAEYKTLIHTIQPGGASRKYRRVGDASHLVGCYTADPKEAFNPFPPALFVTINGLTPSVSLAPMPGDRVYRFHLEDESQAA